MTRSLEPEKHQENAEESASKLDAGEEWTYGDPLEPSAPPPESTSRIGRWLARLHLRSRSPARS